MKKNLVYAALIACVVSSCGETAPTRKKGNELIGQDAVEMLAGPEKRAWKLVAGHSIYDYLLFDNNGGAVVFSMDPPIPYKVVGDELTFTEETGYKAVFSIQQISNDTMVLLRVVDTSQSDAVIEPLMYINLETFRSKGMRLADDVWLKGKTGTVWFHFDLPYYRFKFMNDGKLVHAASGKEATWSLDKNVDVTKGIYPVDILSADYIKLQWGDSLIELHYAGEVK